MELLTAPGLRECSRTQISAVLHRNVSSRGIACALDVLHRRNQARCRRDSSGKEFVISYRYIAQSFEMATRPCAYTRDTDLSTLRLHWVLRRQFSSSPRKTPCFLDP